jgi:hypothetical protein
MDNVISKIGVYNKWTCIVLVGKYCKTTVFLPCFINVFGFLPGVIFWSEINVSGLLVCPIFRVSR